MNDTLNRNAKDKVFKNLLQNRDNLAQFYYDLTGKQIDPDEILYETIAPSIVKGKEEDVAFQLGSTYIILFEAQSTWHKKDIIRFATYMFLLFNYFVEMYDQGFYTKYQQVKVPVVESYIIYTGKEDLPDVVSLDDLYPQDQHSMIDAEMKIVTLDNAQGMVKEYIQFSQLETEYYINHKRTKQDVIELIDYCIEHNILRQYMLEHKREVMDLIENFFTEERRIQGLIDDAVYEERQKAEKLETELRSKEILHLVELDLPKERIVEITGYPLEMVNEVLEQLESDL